MTVRIGTRGSALALAQSGMVAADLERLGARTELVPIVTHGDRSTAPIEELGGTGVFATALRQALLAREVDVVVHSLKDLPTAPADGLAIAAVPARADARDALCARDGLTLAELPAGSRVGTGSPRRSAQVRAARPDLEVVSIRGNVDTRLARLDASDPDRRLDAVVLAAAGLERIGRLGEATELLDAETWPTAPGQGALAIETRTGDELLVAALDEPIVHRAVLAERRVLAVLEAGCSAPLGAHATVDGDRMSLHARVYSLDGSRALGSIHEAVVASDEAALELGDRVARELRDAGADELVPDRRTS